MNIEFSPFTAVLFANAFDHSSFEQRAPYRHRFFSVGVLVPAGLLRRNLKRFGESPGIQILMLPKITHPVNTPPPRLIHLSIITLCSSRYLDEG